MLRILPLLLSLMIFLTACESSEKVPTPDMESKIKIVDTARISRDSKLSKDAMEFIGSIQTKIQAESQEEMAALQAKLKADPENAEIQQEMQMFYGLAQQRLQAEIQNASSIMNDLVLRVVEEYRTKHNLMMILSSETALSYDKSLDITQEIVDILNKQTIEFKSVFGKDDAAKGENTAEEVTPEAQPKETPINEEKSGTEAKPEEKTEVKKADETNSEVKDEADKDETADQKESSSDDGSQSQETESKNAEGSTD